MAKIVLFADGTGNARTAQFRTNVWKLYSALDGRPESGQIAYYHDGVGTSALAPLRLLGGIFGLGLGRNVRALYAFLCRNLSCETDEIHLFGFSRGAFTVRILAGLIHAQGVRHITDEAELARWVEQAYRCNRVRINLAQVGFLRGALIRAVVAIGGRVRSDRAWPTDPLRPKIQLVGVWDTVAAYGGPIIEMVRAFDRWIWPLSMPDYRLSDTVLAARHALALDEEREAFLPLPWDEVGSADPGRIKQVWFAGVHSDVGGGYPDEGLSGVALEWMLDEAKAHGLAFMMAAEAAIGDVANAWAPMHDSRSGVAVGYRYQPRSINALMGLTPNSPLRDPTSGNAPLMTRVIVHDSVLSRIRDPDGYAPIVLPTEFDVDSGAHIALPREGRDHIWDLVSARRWMQRLLLLTGLAAMFAPLYPKPALFAFVDQGLSAPLGAAMALVPLVPAWLKGAYAGAGSWLLVCGSLIWAWIAFGDRLHAKMQRVSAAMWAKRTVSPAAVAADPPSPSRSDTLLDLRRSFLRRLRWQILPGVFGLGFYLAGLLACLTVAAQLALVEREATGGVCAGAGAVGPRFAAGELCHALGVPVRRNHHYRARITVDGGWSDGDVVTWPTGFTYVESFSQRLARRDYAGAARSLFAHLFGISLRREITAHWFAPVIAVRENDSPWLYKVVLTPEAGDDGAYYAHFVAPVDGATWIYVNDAVPPWGPNDLFYRNNRGAAKIEISPEY